MLYLAISPLPTKKVKITLKMLVKEKLTTEQQPQELLAAKQKAEAEENKRKKREYTYLL